jgi:hypothetical protein
VKPLVKSLIEDEQIGQKEGGLGYAEVELDSVLIGDLGVQYMVCHTGEMPVRGRLGC